MKSLKFLIPLALFLVLVLFLARGLRLDPREVPSPLVGKPAPAFSLALLDDPARRVSREDMLGKVWLLNVWASWCTACLIEHPHINAWARTRPPVTLVGLNYKDDSAAGRKWLAQYGNPYAMSLVDGDGRVGIDFGVYGVPESFLIDKKGVIRFKQIGVLTPEVLSQKITPLAKVLDAEG